MLYKNQCYVLNNITKLKPKGEHYFKVAYKKCTHCHLFSRKPDSRANTQKDVLLMELMSLLKTEYP